VVSVANASSDSATEPGSPPLSVRSDPIRAAAAVVKEILRIESLWSPFVFMTHVYGVASAFKPLH
jgi:hypothetical protein